MNSRPWTVVLISKLDSAEVSIVDVFASIEKNSAKKEIQTKFLEKRILAIIPGFHAKYSFSFSEIISTKSSSLENSKIDPFEMSSL